MELALLTEVRQAGEHVGRRAAVMSGLAGVCGLQHR